MYVAQYIFCSYRKLYYENIQIVVYILLNVRISLLHFMSILPSNLNNTYTVRFCIVSLNRTVNEGTIARQLQLSFLIRTNYYTLAKYCT